MFTRILLILLCLSALSTVTGCYYDPYPYGGRPRGNRPYYEGDRRPDYDRDRDYRQRDRERYEHDDSRWNRG